MGCALKPHTPAELAGWLHTEELPEKWSSRRCRLFASVPPRVRAPCCSRTTAGSASGAPSSPTPSWPPPSSTACCTTAPLSRSAAKAIAFERSVAQAYFVGLPRLRSPKLAADSAAHGCADGMKRNLANQGGLNSCRGGIRFSCCLTGPRRSGEPITQAGTRALAPKFAEPARKPRHSRPRPTPP